MSAKEHFLTCDACGDESSGTDEHRVCDVAVDEGWEVQGHNDEDQDLCLLCAEKKQQRRKVAQNKLTDAWVAFKQVNPAYEESDFVAWVQAVFEGV